MDARRDAILRVLGVERYVPRDGTPFADALVPAAGNGVAPAPLVSGITSAPTASDAAPAASDPAPAPMAHDAAPPAIDVDDGPVAPAAAAPRAASRRTAPADLPVLEDVSGHDWEALERAVAACTRCGLEATRTQTVFGVGDRSPDWLVVGEAPGQEEDRRGEPFVGRAGQLLDAMLRSLQLARGQKVYIANTLKCRPPGNRDPQPREVACCMPYLQRQIALLRPKVILCVGRIAAQNLLATDAPLGKLRGRVHRLEPSGTPVVVTYHPAYLLRSPGEKRKAWTDLLYAREVASGHGA